jgi:hypothetical protein
MENIYDVFTIVSLNLQARANIINYGHFYVITELNCFVKNYKLQKNSQINTPWYVKKLATLNPENTPEMRYP